ncbi:MAG: hypothetical protein LBG10_06130 [Treponema sp.]|nr:hypothetical protein [Treponema sp.]
MSLDYPGNDARFEGLRAYREPAALRWSSTDQVGTSSFILSTRSDFTGPPVARINNPPQRITLPRLRVGNYYWTIRVETPDGFDISARAPRRFRVLPIPPLPEAANRLPEDGKIIGGAELRANRRIAFSWDAVAGATGYLFTLENADTGTTVMRQGPMAETGLVLEDLTSLNVGTFTWHLEAILAEPAGERRGIGPSFLSMGILPNYLKRVFYPSALTAVWILSLLSGAGAIWELNLNLPGTISWLHRKILTYRPTYPAPRFTGSISAGFQTG